MDKKHSNTVIRDTSKQNHSSVPNTHIVKDNLNEVGKNKKEKSVNNFNRNHTNNETIIQKKSTKLSYSNNHLNSGSQNSEEVKISNLHDEIPNVETLNSKKKNTELSDKNSRVQSHNNSFGGGDKDQKLKKKNIMVFKDDNISPTKRAELIELNRKKLKENYTKSSKKKKEILSNWNQILKNMRYFDVALFIHCFKIQGDIHIEYDEYEAAKNNYLCHKYLAYRLELLDELMIAYESLGHVYKFLYQYHKSIKCFKKQIEIAWVLKDTRFELLAYDNIGIQYFYLGNRDKARYYHERMMNGMVEPENELKKKTIEQFKEKNFNFFTTDEKEFEKLKPVPKNEDLISNLDTIFDLYRDGDIENIETKLLEGLKISNISESDITFTIMNSEFLNLNSKLVNDDSEEEESCNSKRQISMAYSRKIMPGSYKSKNSKKLNMLNQMKSKEGNLADNMILSHLSLKRKESGIESFDKIFEQFNKKWLIIKKNLESAK